MDGYSILVFVHILALVFWLGTDIGVLVLAKFAQKSVYSVEQRMLLLKVAMILDMFPRVFMVIAFASGTHLAMRIGLIPNNAGLLVGVWLFSALWLAVVIVSFLRDQQPAGNIAKKIEKVIQYSLFAGLLYIGVASLLTGTPIIVTWLAIKVLLFASVLVVIQLLERAFMPAIIGFITLEAEGSSPDVEKQIKEGVDLTVIYVLIIYGIVGVCAYLGVAKSW